MFREGIRLELAWIKYEYDVKGVCEKPLLLSQVGPNERGPRVRVDPRRGYGEAGRRGTGNRANTQVATQCTRTGPRHDSRQTRSDDHAGRGARTTAIERPQAGTGRTEM